MMNDLLLNIPPELANTKCWICATANKRPVNPRTLTGTGWNNAADAVTLVEAAELIGEYVSDLDATVSNVSIIAVNGVVMVDLDGKNHAGNKPLSKEFVWDVAQTLNTYCEYSISGKGYHFYGLTSGGLNLSPTDGKKYGNQIEIYTANHHTVVTGRKVDILTGDGCNDVTDAIQTVWYNYIGKPYNAEIEAKSSPTAQNTAPTADDATAQEFIRLNFMNAVYAVPATMSRDRWMMFGSAFKQAGLTGRDFEEWSKTGGDKYRRGEPERVFDGLTVKSNPVKIVFADAKANGFSNWQYVKAPPRRRTVPELTGALHQAITAPLLMRGERGWNYQLLFHKGDISHYSTFYGATLALLNVLAFYCDYDEELIDAAYMYSALYRINPQYWDDDTARARTLRKAIGNHKRGDGYRPRPQE